MQLDSKNLFSAMTYLAAAIKHFEFGRQELIQMNTPCYISAEQMGDLMNCANTLKIAGQACDMVATVGAAERLATFVDGRARLLGKMSADDLGSFNAFASQAISSFSDEMASRVLIALRPIDHALVVAESPFGEAVIGKFQKQAVDLQEASRCLALGRYTASVFHLMRVMEAAVQRLGKKLKVKADIHKATWYVINQDITNAVSAMPGKTARDTIKKQKYANAAANLNSVRMAWRNEVMHPKAQYTRDEAHSIYNHVKEFLIVLAPLV